MVRNSYTNKTEQLLEEFQAHIMDKIEHFECAVLFERFRDFRDEIKPVIEMIKDKEKDGDLI